MCLIEPVKKTMQLFRGKGRLDIQMLGEPGFDSIS
jgi:hypothetical protein